MPCVPATDCTGGTWGDNPESLIGSHDPALIGKFEIPVPPGQYTVEVRALGQDGKLGPFDPVLPMPGPEEYWDVNESDHDGAAVLGFTLADLTKDVITVAAGQSVNNIDVILNGTEPTYDLFDQPTATPGADRNSGAKQTAINAGGAR
jgi:hypothetical protein